MCCFTTVYSNSLSNLDVGDFVQPLDKSQILHQCLGRFIANDVVVIVSILGKNEYHPPCNRGFESSVPMLSFDSTRQKRPVPHSFPNTKGLPFGSAIASWILRETLGALGIEHLFLPFALFVLVHQVRPQVSCGVLADSQVPATSQVQY
jgi:hypothetical protein